MQAIKAKGIKYLSPIYEQVDELLARMAKLKGVQHERTREMEAKIEEILQQYTPFLDEVNKEIDTLDRQIKKILKQNREDFFSETQRCELQHGAVLYHSAWKVKRARGVLEKLEQLGFTEAIKVTKTVKWHILEEWPDEKLFMVGTERKLKEDYGYEIYG